MNKEIHIPAEAIKDGVLMIREGQLPSSTPIILSEEDCLITGPAEYCLLREIDEDKSIVVVSVSGMSIVLVENCNDPYPNTIAGSLKLSRLFTGLKINGDSPWNHKDLAMHFKMNAHLFQSREKAMETFAKLNKLKIKVDTEIDKEEDLRGSKRDIFIQKVIENSVPESINLKVPIFEGEDPVEINVELIVSSGDFSITLISPWANTYVEEESGKIIAEQTKKIREKYPKIPIVNAY